MNQKCYMYEVKYNCFLFLIKDYYFSGKTKETDKHSSKKQFEEVNNNVITEKLNFIQLQKKLFLEEYKLKMEILKLKKEIKEKKLDILRKM